MPTPPVRFPTAGARILVPLDLSGDGDQAFNHALRFAVAARGEVHPVFVHRPGGVSPWKAMPKARDALVRWRLLPDDAGVGDFAALGCSVHPQEVVSRNIVDGVVQGANARDYDLVVLQTHQRHALGAWLERSVSRTIARRLTAPVLFLPALTKGLVSDRSGLIQLHHVLLPIGKPELAEREIHAAEAFGRMVGVPRAQGTLLRIGDSMPDVRLDESWSWDTRVTKGPLAQTIADSAQALDVDLIVMVTKGRDSLRDVLTGSITERVLDRVSCPVLVIEGRE